MVRSGSRAAWFVVALAILCRGVGAEARGEHPRRTPIVEAVEKTRAGIVSIKVEKKGNWGRNEKSVGTGVIVEAHGYEPSGEPKPRAVAEVEAGDSGVVIDLE